MADIKVRGGLKIPLQGAARPERCTIPAPETYALKATDFPDVRRPKVLVEEGETVKVGTPLFFDKLLPQVLYTAPASGEVVQIARGERRALQAIVILADTEFSYVSFPRHAPSKLSSLDRASILGALCKSGIWPRMVQRPYGVVANPEDTPRDIYISAFNSHPLAPDYTYTLSEDKAFFEAGVAVLGQLTSGHINIGCSAVRAGYFGALKNEKVHIHTFRGAHPVGNVGVHIYHTRPLAPGDLVWTVSPYGVVQIGKLFLEGRYDTSVTLALTGSQVTNPCYYDTHTGASLKNIVAHNVKSADVRCISGNVLTGECVEKEGYLGYYHDQLTVIPEGKRREFFGWIRPSAKKFSMQRALGLFSFLFPHRLYELNANTHGEPRAFVQTGLFQKLLPMGIHIDHLLKAILAKDYEEMEALGIGELVEEDVALCEFADASKHEIQRLLREGIELIRSG